MWRRSCPERTPTLLMLALAVGCAEPEPRTFDFAENPCGLDRPTRLTDALYAGGLIELGNTHGTMLSWIPSDVPRHGLTDAVVAERFDLCGDTSSEPAAMPLRPAGRGGYSCGPLGLRWTDDLATAPIELRHAPTDCRGVVATDHGLFLAEDGALWWYRSPQDTPEALVTDIDTEAIYGQVYSDTAGWPLAIHGHDLFYLATGGLVRSVDLQTGLRSFLADGASALYGHPEVSLVAWVKGGGTVHATTIYFPDEGQAVQVPGIIDSLAEFDGWIVTRDDDRIGLYRPESNDLRVYSSQGTPRLIRIDGGWAYLIEGASGVEPLALLVALNLSDGETRTLLSRAGHYLNATDNPYGEGVLAYAQSVDEPLGTVFQVDLDGAHELAREVSESYILMGDGSLLYQHHDGSGNASVRYRPRGGDERIVAWDAGVVGSPVEHLHGDALFVVGPGEHVGLWRMPAIPR